MAATRQELGQARAWVAQLGRWLLAANLLVSAMALGALHTPVLAICCGVAAVSAAFVWYDTKPLEARPAATLLVMVALGLLAWTALQAVPLPRGLVSAIAHENADVWSRALTPLREDGPSYVTLSLDPTATRVQLLRGVLYLLTFVTALRVAHRPAGIAFLERAIVACGIAMALAAVLHPVFGAQKVFGAYQPGETYAYDPRHIAPLLNANHMAGYVTIGALVALASAVRKTDTMPRPLAVAATVLLVAGNLWASSRGGTGALALGVLLTVGLAVGARRSERPKLLGFGASALAIVVGVFLVVLSASDEARNELASADVSKLAVVKNALGLVRTYPVFGVGRGAFESVFPSIREGTGYLVFTHPENVIAQWLTEWGLPSALALAACAWALRPQTALARAQPPVGAWAALAALAIQNLVDFSSEVPGVVVALVVCAAIVSGGSGGRASANQIRTWSRRPGALSAAGAAAALGAIAMAAPFASGELYTEQRELKDFIVEQSRSRELVRARLREAMLRHPAEAYFPFLGAVRASVAKDESVLPWAARALERSPVYGRAHLLLARYLYRQSPSHARLEYRLAVEQDEGLTGYVIAEAPGLVRDLDDALQLAPPGRAGVAVLDGLAGGIAKRLPATAARIDAEITSLDPTSLASARRAAAGALTDLRNHEPWCEPVRECLAQGLGAAERIQKAEPDKCEGYALAGELRAASGEADAGLDEIERALDRIAERSACTRRLIALALNEGRTARADVALDRFLRMGCEAAAACVDDLLFAASVDQQRGNRRRALAHYKRAAERAPDRVDLLETVARVASAEGLHGEALDAYTKLAARAPGDKRWSDGVARENAALQAELLAPKP